MKGKLYTRRMLNTLQSIQARAGRVISGAYRATSRVALGVESFLLPIEQQIWKHNADTITRLLSSRDIAATSGFQAEMPTIKSINLRPPIELD